MKSTSTISRISARDRPLQLPVLKKLRPRGELKPVKSTRRLKVSSRRRTFRAPISIEKVLSLFDNGRYGDFAKLSDVIEQDVTLVAIDTEFERRGLVHHAVEIGISTLSVKDVFLSNMLPGSHAKNWISQMKHSKFRETSLWIPDVVAKYSSSPHCTFGRLASRLKNEGVSIWIESSALGLTGQG